MVDLHSDVTFSKSGKTETRALDLTPYKDVRNYTVELKDASGNVIQSKRYGEMELTQEIEPGSYTFRAFYGENVNAAYDKLYVEGSQTFSIEEDNTKSISFTCIPANVKVKIKYSEDFFSYFSDCTVGLQTKHLTSPFKIKKSEIDKDLFMKADASDEKLNITFELKDKEGKEIIPEGFGAQEVQIEPRDFLTITVKPKLIEIEGGIISGIQIVIDDAVKEEIIDIILPDDLIPGEDTEVNN